MARSISSSRSLRIASERDGRGSGWAEIQASIQASSRASIQASSRASIRLLRSSDRRDSSIGSIFVVGRLGVGFFISRPSSAARQTLPRSRQ